MATPIAPQDLAFLLMEGREKPAHVGGLQLFEPPEDGGPHYLLEMYRAAIESDGEVRNLFRRRVERPGGIGPYLWDVDERFDIEYHVRHSALPEPGRIRELLALTSRLHGSLLDRNRPLWESHLIEGLDDGRFALYTKVHHALVDGVTAMRLMVSSMSTDPDETGMPMPWERRRGEVDPDPEPQPDAEAPPELDPGTWASLAGDALRRATGAMREALEASQGVADLIGRFAEQVTNSGPRPPRTMLNVPITGARRFAAQSWSLDRVKAAGADHGATVNDMVLAMSGGALRAYLLEQDALPDEPLVAMVPVSLKTRGAGDDAGNAVGAILCSLGTHLESPTARLEHIQESMRANKARMEGLSPGQILALSALSVAPAAVHLTPLGRLGGERPVFRPPFNVTISNVPGPQQTLYWNGARMDGSYPVSVLVDGQALNITTTSYAGSLDFGIIGCRRNVPSLQRMLTFLDEELAGIEKGG